MRELRHGIMENGGSEQDVQQALPGLSTELREAEASRSAGQSKVAMGTYLPASLATDHHART
jgi:hypothetical protein